MKPPIIESGVELPPAIVRSPAYPDTRDMEVGQSFVVSYPEDWTDKTRFYAHRVRCAMNGRHRKAGWKFSVRQLSNGVRIWRVK